MFIFHSFLVTLVSMAGVSGPVITGQRVKNSKVEWP